MHKLSLSLLGALALSFTTTLPAQDALFGGFVEGADFFMYVDADTISQAPIVKKMKDMRSPEQIAEEKASSTKFQEITGLGENDLDTVAFSADLDTVDFENPEKTDFNAVSGIMAMAIKKSITLQQLEAGAKAMMEQHDSADEAKLAIETREGIEFLSIKPTTPEADGPQEVLIGLSEDGKTVLVSFNMKSLANGLGRIQSKKAAQPSADMATAIRAMQKEQLRTAFIFPKFVTDQIAEQAQANPMGAMFTSMKGMLFSATATDSLAFGIKMDMGNPQSAAQLSAMAQQMMPMGIAQAGAMLPPDTAKILQKIKVGADQNFFSIDLDLTEADMKSIGNAAMMMMGGMMMQGMGQ
jgi:hypothetical protein